ncbi:hypothetical protein AKJ40_00695 [candidate division MSBL1 archaeon SCGC-AAA259M10]|uniref:Uncharacterized protein n=1 Tax=candidate division MSBL1 archaeon SCGC-AAA259M10 TaxID=1698270 RepID=A0A133V2P0_9EURY|nr:hypothetical protein AKJ40_00695 [candidate division MSBL1 archaeon SCGC-AAA259M10]
MGLKRGVVRIPITAPNSFTARVHLEDPKRRGARTLFTGLRGMLACTRAAGLIFTSARILNTDLNFLSAHIASVALRRGVTRNRLKARIQIADLKGKVTCRHRTNLITTLARINLLNLTGIVARSLSGGLTGPLARKCFICWFCGSQV